MGVGASQTSWKQLNWVIPTLMVTTAANSGLGHLWFSPHFSHQEVSEQGNKVWAQTAGLSLSSAIFQLCNFGGPQRMR